MDAAEPMSRDADVATGVVAFSFGKRADAQEPNPSNAALARTVADLVHDHRDAFVVVAQWEVARGLVSREVVADLVVDESADGTYLSSDDVWAAASALFASQGVTRVVPVAHPFLHARLVRRLVEADGFVCERVEVGHVPFDDSAANQQWWTKGRGRLLVYSGMRVVRSIASRRRMAVSS